MRFQKKRPSDEEPTGRAPHASGLCAHAPRNSETKNQHDMSKGSSMSSAAKRIQKELAEISLEPPTNCSAGPKGDNLYEWVSSIMGPSGAPNSSPFFFPSPPPPRHTLASSVRASVCGNLVSSPRRRPREPMRLLCETDDFLLPCPHLSPRAPTHTQVLLTLAACSSWTFTFLRTIPSNLRRWVKITQ